MKRKFYKDSDFAQVGAGWEAFQEIAQAETEGRLMVLHLKGKWWVEIAWENKNSKTPGELDEKLRNILEIG